MISKNEIAAFSKYVLDISGIYLDQSKGYLLESRLKGLMDEYGADSFEKLLNLIKGDQTQKLKKSLIDAISTNETYFFRDNVPFDLLRNKILPDLIDLRRKQNPNGTIPIRIWSAACSTGQEVYSIAITLMELQAGMGMFDNSILGTDISSDAIGKASYGQYNNFEVERGLPLQTRQKYFTQTGNGWRIRDEIRSLARFDSINLIKPFPLNYGPFDVIFCRNVAIYFQNHDKIALFRKIAKVLAPGGALIVGGSESLTGTAQDFVNQQYLKGNYYILKRDQTGIASPATSIAGPAVARKKISPSVSRKTVFDKPRKRPFASVKKTEARKAVQSVKVDVVKTIISSNSESNLLDSSQNQKPGKANEKSSLLKSIQKENKAFDSLLGGKQSGNKLKSSLLDRISSRNKKK
jgi:chemotaxis methyl-accepting protein methylase